MPIRVDVKFGLTGGTATDLDSVAVAGITDGDPALVDVGGVHYHFAFDSADTSAEQTTVHPYIVRPDDNAFPNAGVWVEQMHSIYGGYEPTDRTVSPTSGMTAAQIQALIDGIGKYIPYGTTITVQFGDGTYNTSMTSTLEFSGFYGGGILILQGNRGEADANSLHTTQSVFLDTSASNLNPVLLTNNSVYLVVQNFKIAVDNDPNTIAALRLINCHYLVAINYNYFYGSTTARGYGIRADYCPNVWTYRNYVSTVRQGILATGLSRVMSYENDDTGTLPMYGLWAQNGAVIAKYSTAQPAGSTANEYTGTGGTIVGP